MSVASAEAPSVADATALEGWCARRWNVLLAASLLIASLSHAHFFASDVSIYVWDSPQYWDSARQMAEGHGFRDRDGRIEGRRTPGYPAMLTALQWAGLKQRGAAAVQHLVVLALAAAVGITTRRLSGSHLAGLVAVLFTGLDPGEIVMANLIMAEVALSAVLFGAFAVLLAALRRRSLPLLAAGALLVGYSALVKPAALYLGIAITPWVALFWPGARWRRRTAAALLFLVFAAALPGLWIQRNQRVLGVPMFSSIVGEIVYAWRGAGVVAMEKTGFAYAPFFHSDQEDAFHHEFFSVVQPRMAREGERALVRHYGRPIGSISEVEKSAFLEPIGAAILRRHFPTFVLLTFNGVLHLLFDPSWDYATRGFGAQWRESLLWLMSAETFLTFPLAAAGLLLLWRRSPPGAALLALMLLYFVAISSGPESEQWRYRVGMIPMYATAIGTGAAWAWSVAATMLRRRRRIETRAESAS